MGEISGENEYQTYLLRLWREPTAPAQRQPVWRCSIEDTRTHNRRGFRSVEDLTNHLRALAGRSSAARGLEIAAHEEQSGAE